MSVLSYSMQHHDDASVTWNYDIVLRVYLLRLARQKRSPNVNRVARSEGTTEFVDAHANVPNTYSQSLSSTTGLSRNSGSTTETDRWRVPD